MSRRPVVLAALALALVLTGVVIEWGDGDEHPCAVAWTATDAEYERHVECERNITRNPDRRMP